MTKPTQSLTLAAQLSQRLALRIRDRLLPAGTRLPSVRETARAQGVNPSTVVAAYDQLLAWGLVESQPRKGYFVRSPPRQTGEAGVPRPPTPVEGAGGARDPVNRPPMDATALIRGMFHRDSDKPQPGMGLFPADWMANSFLPAALRKVVGSAAMQEASLRYGEPMGDPGLRAALSQRLRSLAIDAAPAQILTTVGATHALDIVSRTLLKPGDAVMVEEPGWAVEFARLDALGMRILPVPRGPEGPDLDVITRYCEHAPDGQAPRLLVSVSVLHNPTGYCLSPSHSHRLLQLAHTLGFDVVEDDTYGHLAPPHAIRLCALDGLRHTLYVGGFAKLLAPSWRVGFLAAPQRWVERLVDTKLLGTLTTPSLLEQALALCMEQGQLHRHAQRMRSRLDAARSCSVNAALAAGCRFVSEPAGLFGWVDTGVDTERLAQHMLDLGYLLAPGALFHAARTPSTLMRINFATTQDAVFWSDFQRVRAQIAR